MPGTCGNRDESDARYNAAGGEDGRIYGLLQLSDKSGGRDFDADDEEHIRELAALVGEALDAGPAASSIS